MTAPRSTLALLASLATAVSCAGLETGNASRPPSLVTASLSVGAAPPVDRDGVTFGLTSARANVRRIDFALPDGVSCADVAALDAATLPFCEGDTVRLEGPFVFDLRTGVATPALPAIALPPGRYRRVEVRFDDADPADGVVAPSDPLAGNTVVAEGTTTLNGAPTPFRLALDFSEEARFESLAGIDLAEGAASLLLELDASAWFADLPLAECADDGDLPIEQGVIVITDGDGSCSDVESAVRDAIEASGELRD